MTADSVGARSRRALGEDSGNIIAIDGPAPLPHSLGVLESLSRSEGGALIIAVRAAAVASWLRRPGTARRCQFTGRAGPAAGLPITTSAVPPPQASDSAP